MWALKVITDILPEGGRGGFRTAEGKTETGMRWPQAKECQQPPGVGQGKEWVLLRPVILVLDVWPPEW